MDNRIIFSFCKNYDKNRSMTAFFFFFFLRYEYFVVGICNTANSQTFDTYILLMYIEFPSP